MGDPKWPPGQAVEVEVAEGACFQERGLLQVRGPEVELLGRVLELLDAPVVPVALTGEIDAPPLAGR